MAESISPERMQRLMELSNNAMTVELGALRNPQVTTVPLSEPEAFYKTTPNVERFRNNMLRRQYKIIQDNNARLQFEKRYADSVPLSEHEKREINLEIIDAQKEIEKIKNYTEEAVAARVKGLQLETVADIEGDFSLSGLDQARDQLVLSDSAEDTVLAHELGHGAFSEAKDFFLRKIKELGSITAAEEAVSLEYGEAISRAIAQDLRNTKTLGFPDTNEGIVQYYDNPQGDDPLNPGVGTPTFKGGATYYSPDGGFQGMDAAFPKTTDPLLQKPFTDYRTGELVYHDEYKGGTEQHDEGDFETDLKKSGLMGFETLMSDLISEKKGWDRFAERQRRGLKINPLGAPKGEVLRSVRPKTRPENFAQGGPVMRGIGTLNETARNMTRGPRGIGAYQQFAGGGEANPELPPARGLPPTKNPFGDGIRELEDLLSKPQGRGKGYFDDVNFRIDSYEIDGKPSYAIEFDDGFSLFEPQIIEMMDENNSANEPIPGERTRKELFRYLFEKNPTSEEFFRYLKTTGLASGGEVSGPDPRGIGAFQQFADGGTAQNDLNRLNTLFENAPSNNFTLTEAPFVFMPNESELSALERERLESTYGGDNRYVFEQKKLPVSGTIQYQKNRDGSKRFDAEIEKKFKGELGSITPSARYSTQRSSKRSGNIIVDETGRQVGIAVEGEIYIDPDSENKLKGAIDVENSKKSRSFTIPEGQILKTEDGRLLKKFNLGVDLGSLGLDATYFDDSKKGTRAEGSATIKIGDNGIIKYNDSSDGRPTFSAKYATDLGDGEASLNYENDLRNVPRYGAELNTKFGEGVGSLSYRNDGRGNTFGVGYNITFASGGEVSGPPPTRGPDPQGIGAYQQFADGGPVYMQEGGDPNFKLLVQAVQKVESNFDSRAVSEDGAIGLMQILPTTAAQPGYEKYGAENVFDIAERLMGFRDERTVENARALLFDPEINVEFGTKYLQAMIRDSGGDILQALQKYNAGVGNYQAFEEDPENNPLDQEAVQYPIKVTAAYQNFDPSNPLELSQFSNRPEAASQMMAMYEQPEPELVRPRLRPEFLGDKGVTTSLRPQLRPQGIMSIQDPAVMDRVVEQVQEELPPTEEERDLYEKYSPENMFPDAGLTESEMIRRERFAPKEGDAEPYRQPRSMEEKIQGFFDKFKPSRKPIFTVRPTLKDTVV